MTHSRFIEIIAQQQTAMLLFYTPHHHNCGP